MRKIDQALELLVCNEHMLHHCCRAKKPNKKDSTFTDKTIKQGIHVVHGNNNEDIQIQMNKLVGHYSILFL